MYTHEPPAGSRVYAIRDADPEVIHWFGPGTYVGDEVPPSEAPGFGGLTDLPWPNPKIVLDSGEVVWGMQCWWGPLEHWEQVLGTRRAELVTLAATLEEHARGK